jgi:hypothetical protein
MVAVNTFQENRLFIGRNILFSILESANSSLPLRETLSSSVGKGLKAVNALEIFRVIPLAYFLLRHLYLDQKTFPSCC